MKRSLFTTATALLFCLSLASAALAYTEAELDFLFQYGEYQRHIGTPDYLADISAKGNLEVAHTTCLNL
ncbi:MAG: hypothetical protein LH679_13580, partial [Cyanobacteria bacterium CAN_BIN43]|nr:hypothetical protein [Cyanobacteria bacterium CAN_BIN43]